jgi:hypothetical protein
MRTKWLAATAALVMGTALVSSGEAAAQYPAQQAYYQPPQPPVPIHPSYQPQLYLNQDQAWQFVNFYYYPYYYFPHSYWPVTSPRWPEAPGQHYMKPPAYMAYPPFQEPYFRYEAWQPAKYYSGFHFWLDQF